MHMIALVDDLEVGVETPKNFRVAGHAHSRWRQAVARLAGQMETVWYAADALVMGRAAEG